MGEQELGILGTLSFLKQAITGVLVMYRQEQQKLSSEAFHSAF